MSTFTVLGAGGFIGSHIVKKLAEQNLSHYAPTRNQDLAGKHLGHVFYCIGLTADFRTRPFETLNAHVCNLLNLLQTCDFDSLLYLSSTRLYSANITSAREEDEVCVNSLNSSDLYNISKLAGESLLFASGKRVRIARLSNVYGAGMSPDNFLSMVIAEAITKKCVTLHSTLDSEKDYISIDNAVNLLIKIALGGRHNIYNVASGANTSNREVMRQLQGTTGCEVEVAPDAATSSFPEIDVKRVSEEFGFAPTGARIDLNEMIEEFKSKRSLT